jgi:hypothetical protein
VEQELRKFHPELLAKIISRLRPFLTDVGKSKNNKY